MRRIHLYLVIDPRAPLHKADNLGATIPFKRIPQKGDLIALYFYYKGRRRALSRRYTVQEVSLVGDNIANVYIF